MPLQRRYQLGDWGMSSSVSSFMMSPEYFPNLLGTSIQAKLSFRAPMQKKNFRPSQFEAELEI